MAVFSQEELQLLRTLPEVVEGRRRLAKTPVVTITVTLPESIREALQKHWGIELKRAPLRWIRGDTLPHEDRGAYAFTDTYLVYLTDGNGKLTIGKDTHAMKSGCGFKFSEGTRHCVTHTNGTSRLMLGPMTSRGMYVGGSNLIFANPGETVYLDQLGDLSMRYKKGIDGAWFALISGTPITLINNNPAGGIIRVLFSSDIVVTDPSLYLVVGSEKIQIGDTAVKPDGTRPTITVDGVTGYLGFIENGGLADGYSDISVYNLNVSSQNGSTLDDYAGWVGQSFFGKNALNNSFLYCSSDGYISTKGGGIVGNGFANADGGTASGLIVGCSSTGDMDQNAGGIAGSGCGNDGTVLIRNCWSTGIMDDDCGGIVGAESGGGIGSCVVEKCYSTGSGDGYRSGGIFGSFAGINGGTAVALYCYSTGGIVFRGGGIFGDNSAKNLGTVTATQCYSTGSIDAGGGGIIGGYTAIDPQGTVTVNDCYTSGATAAPTGYIIAGDPTEGGSGSNYSEAYNGGTGWSTTNAAVTIGLVAFVDRGANTPFALRDFGPSPYNLVTIAPSGTDLTLSYAVTLVEGTQSIGGVLAEYTEFSIVDGDPEIVIDLSTGVITAPAYDPLKPTYTFYVEASGNGIYSITTFVLTVTSSGPPTPPTPTTTFALGGKGFSPDTYTDLLGGRLLVLERIPNPNLRFEAFDDYHRYRKAWAVNHN